jgi:hypothetical protein
MGLDTKTYRLTDRQSQCVFDFGIPDEGERPPLEAATEQRLVKTEETLCLP